LKETNKLVEARFIREVIYPEWFAKMVMMKKPNEKWWMLIDFTNLNKAYLKYNFSLSKIDCLVDSTTGFEYLSSLDTNSGYHQISMYLIMRMRRHSSLSNEHLATTSCYLV